MKQTEALRRVLEAYKPTGYVERCDLDEAREELAAIEREIEELESEIADLREAYRALRALGEGGRLLDRERLIGRFNALTKEERPGQPARYDRHDAADLTAETAHALAAGLLSDEAIDAMIETLPSMRTVEDQAAGAVRKALTAALRRVLGGDVPAARPAYDYLANLLGEKTAERDRERARADREKARADKAEAERDEYARSLADVRKTLDEERRDVDALAAEVEGLRALPTRLDLRAYYESHGFKTSWENASLSWRQADMGPVRRFVERMFATVPRAAVAPAAKGDRVPAVAPPPDLATDLPPLATDEEIDASDCPATAADVRRWEGHDEAKRKAAAEALRALAVKLRGYADLHSNPNRADALRWTAKQAEADADALWPRKGAGRG